MIYLERLFNPNKKVIVKEASFDPVTEETVSNDLPIRLGDVVGGFRHVRKGVVVGEIRWEDVKWKDPEKEGGTTKPLFGMSRKRSAGFSRGEIKVYELDNKADAVILLKNRKK